MSKVSLLKRIKILGYVWAATGLLIVGLSNFILISNISNTYWFLPINVRNNLLTAILLLLPAVIIFVSTWLLKKENHAK